MANIFLFLAAFCTKSVCAWWKWQILCLMGMTNTSVRVPLHQIAQNKWKIFLEQKQKEGNGFKGRHRKNFNTVLFFNFLTFLLHVSYTSISQAKCTFSTRNYVLNHTFGNRIYIFYFQMCGLIHSCVLKRYTLLVRYLCRIHVRERLKN